MAKERDLVRFLIQKLQDYEVEIDAISTVLAAMRMHHPQFPALEMLKAARQYPQLQIDAQERYKHVLEVLDSADSAELLDMIPASKSPQ